MSKEAQDPGSRFAGFESIPLAVTVSVGRARCKLGQLSRLKPGDVIDLDRNIGGPLLVKWGDRYLVGGRKTIEPKKNREVLPRPGLP